MGATEHLETGIFKQIARTFVAGLLAALPLALTLAVIVWSAEFIQRFLGPKSTIGKLLESFGLRFVSSEIVAYLLGVVLTLLLVYLIGVLVEAGLKNRWQFLIDYLFQRIPLVRTVYQTVSRLLEMFEPRDQSSLKAMSAVMCHLGGKGGTAVLALMPSPESVTLSGREYKAVLIPTAPVPFGGAILYVPEDWVEPADFAFDGLLNIYMSMGANSSDYLHPQSPLANRAAGPSGNSPKPSD